MQPYVNKVLTRGKTQRSESVSCSEGRSHRKDYVWRKPDEIPDGGHENEEGSKNEGDADDGKHVKEASSKCTVCKCIMEIRLT